MPKKFPSIKLTAEDKEMLEKHGFTIGKPINGGEYGIVYLATYCVKPQTNEDDTEQTKVASQENNCAAKVINMSGLADKKDLNREIFMMNRIKHPHIVKVYDMFQVAPSSLIIFMELAEGGDLCDLLSEERGWIDEYRASKFYRQFGDAIKFMHLLGFAHRDLKLENILLADKERTITKLTDFGFSRAVFCPITGKPTMASTWCGTVDYMAPELLSTKANTKLLYDAQKSDVWSIGVILFLLLNDDFPFGGNGKEKEMLALQTTRQYVHFNKSLSDGAKEVIDMHFEPDPVKRPTIHQILKHSWFDEECWRDD